MRGVLVFAPHADPTYTPLGLAALAAHVRVHAPTSALVPLDLNHAWWEHLAAADPAVGALRTAMRTDGEAFYDPVAYAPHRRTWSRAATGAAGLAAPARRWLEHDEMVPDLRAFLEFGARLVTAAEPAWIGFSALYPGQVLPSLALARYLAEDVYGPGRHRPQLILGGASAAALRPQELLAACPFLDGVFAGEGESGLAALLAGAPPASIPGLAYRGDGNVQINRKPDTLAAETIVLPLFEDLDPAARWNPTPVLPAVYSRGCKWRRCRFCAHNLSYSGYRRHAAGRFADHLVALQERHGCRHVYFADQYVDAEDLEALSLAILDRGLEINFHVMGRPTEAYTPGRLQTMARAGCRWISWGVETGSARLLEACGKGTTPAGVRRVMLDAHEAGIHNLMMMILGLPTSTDEDLQASMDLVADLGPAAGDVTGSCFQLFDRTPFAAQADRWGLRVTGRDVLLSRLGQRVHSLRLFHQERAGDGAWRPPRGPLESARWDEFRRWTGTGTGLEHLCCEHTLLYAGRPWRASPARPAA